VTGLLGVQEHAGPDDDDLRRVDPALAPPVTWLGALGISGPTASFGIFDVGRVRPGETVGVSGAAGRARRSSSPARPGR
jgi:NADPH-dependent curcumin reductase CurA